MFSRPGASVLYNRWPEQSINVMVKHLMTEQLFTKGRYVDGERGAGDIVIPRLQVKTKEMQIPDQLLNSGKMVSYVVIVIIATRTRLCTC